MGGFKIKRLLQKLDFYTVSSLAILIISNILIRIPVGMNYVGEGSDSDIAMFCLMAESISNDGAKWLLHSASIFGLADFSYPSFVPFFLAGMAQITGLIRLDLLIPLSLILGAVCVIVGYKMGQAYLGDQTIALFTAFAFSLSPIAIEYSRVFSFARLFFLIFSALIFYFIFKYERDGGIRNIAAIILLSALDLMTHRMALLLLVLLMGSYGLSKAYPILIRNEAIINREREIFCMMGALEFLFIFSPFYPFKSNLVQLQHGMLFSGTSAIITILNMMVDYVTFINPFILLAAILGLVLVLNNKNRSFIDRFLLFYVLLCIPLLSNSSYCVHLLIFVGSLFFAVSVKYIYFRINANPVFLSTIFILVVIFSLMLSPPLKDTIFHHEDTYPGMPQTAKYLSGLDGDIKTEDNFISRILMLYGHRSVYPFMGPEYPIYYNNFGDGTFSLDLHHYLETNMYYLFKYDNKIDIIPNFKYEYSRENKQETRVYDNSRERIYKAI